MMSQREREREGRNESQTSAFLLFEAWKARHSMSPLSSVCLCLFLSFTPIHTIIHILENVFIHFKLLCLSIIRKTNRAMSDSAHAHMCNIRHMNLLKINIVS